MRSWIQGTIAAGVATVVVSCGPSGSPPELDRVADQNAFVGQELEIVLQASDPDGSSLAYSFEADVPDIHNRAELSQIPGGAEFRWTPVADDVGEWFFNFTVSDGNHSDTVTVRVDVSSASGQSPVFREPLGEGTALDVSQNSCIEIEVLVESETTSQVQLGEEAPKIENAEFEQTSGLEGVWSWCPSDGQIEQSNQYLLTLSADDGENPVATKEYLIVLQQGSNADCPGEPPTIEHSETDEDTLAGLTISANVTDEVGLKYPPILYYSEDKPADPPNLGGMNPVEMLLIEGDRSEGLWAADVPNPVAGEGEGSQAEVYYVISAESEADSEDKKCSNLALSPESSSYAMTVTNPGGTASLGLCEGCTADVQCGEGGDLCVRVGGASEASCLEGCTTGSCPSGYTCSQDPVTSVDGESARQCLPDNGTCGTGEECVDDEFSPNHSPGDAADFEPGSYDLNMCPAAPGEDEDWFFFEITEEDELSDIRLRGGDHTDLDLWLLDIFGGVVDRSISFDSEEDVFPCLPPGGYYVLVNEAFVSEENPYTLSYETLSADCAELCENDEFEPDDSLDEARVVEPVVPDHESQGFVCPDDSDFFAVDLFDGETLFVELLFEQLNILEDLDIRFYDPEGTLLTPCSEENSDPCNPENGQSETSDEYFEHTVDNSDCQGTEPCTYYVEIRGFADSRKAYDIRIGLDLD